jgi:1-acyl-sn-glycerol-3-phosphate acyltransferase
MTNQYHVPLRNKVARVGLRPFFRSLFHILSSVKIYGKNNVPKGGPYLICMNHVSLYDPPFMIAFWPICPEAVGAVELWDRRGIATLARVYGGIPVHRGQYDRALLETMTGVLAAGRPLLIAPEGQRSHAPGLQRGHPGVAYIAEKMNVRIIPVGIVGATDDFLSNSLKAHRPTIAMHIGLPFKLPTDFAAGKPRKVIRQENADLIMLHIAKLLPENYRGYYGESFSQSR